MAAAAQDQLMKQFRARKTTVFKKAAELSTLCGVDVLLVCYDPDSPKAPQTLSSKPDPSEIVNEYLRRSKMEGKGVNNKLMMISSKKNQLIDIPNMTLNALNDLDCVLAGKIDDINQRINLIKSAVGSSNNSSSGGNNYEVPSSSSLTSDCDGNNNNKIMIDFNQSYSLDDVEFEEEVNNDNTHQVGNSVCNGNNSDGLSLDDLDFEGCDQMWSAPQYVVGDDQMMKSCDGFQTIDQVWASPEQYNEETELMIDVSDFGDFRFHYDDHDHSLDLINKFATADNNCAFAPQIPCY